MNKCRLKDVTENRTQHTHRDMMSLDPAIYSQSGDEECLRGVIDKTEHLSIGSKPDELTEFHQSELLLLDIGPGSEEGVDTSVALDYSRKDCQLKWTNEETLGNDSRPESSQTEQQTGALISKEEYAAALEEIKRQKEMIENLNKELSIAKGSHVKNQHSVEAVAESSQTSLEDSSVKGVIPLTKRRGRMAKEDRDKIITKMPFLIEKLNPEHLIPTMFSKHLICEDEADELRTTLQERAKCADNMLWMLLRCGPHAYKIFLKCLELTGYSNVIEELEPKCKKYEGNIKYPGEQYYELIDNKSPNREEFIKKTEMDLEEIYDSTEFVVIRKLTKGCVQVTFQLLSWGSKNENELREVLESKVNSGYIGDRKVSTESFSFNKTERGHCEEIDTGRNGEDQDSQLASHERFIQLKKKIEELEGFNLRLRIHIAELETELDEAGEIASKRIINLEKDIRTLKLQINELQNENTALKHSKEMEKQNEHEANSYTDTLLDLPILPTDDDQGRDLAIAPVADDQDKDKGAAPPIDTMQIEQSQFCENQVKVVQIVDYLVNHHPGKLKPLVHVLGDNEVIDDDDKDSVIKCIESGNIKVAAWRLSKTLTSRSGNDPYRELTLCLPLVGLSYIVDLVHKGNNAEPVDNAGKGPD